jgi:DNA polymerase III sliding clamp (beta) subunit (PCNA family)
LQGERVRVALKDGGASTLITPDEDEPSFRYVVMPMRL